MATRKIGVSKKVPKCWRRETPHSFINKSNTSQVRIRPRSGGQKYQVEFRGLKTGDVNGEGCKDIKSCEKKAFEFMRKANQC